MSTTSLHYPVVSRAIETRRTGAVGALVGGTVPAAVPAVIDAVTAQLVDETQPALSAEVVESILHSFISPDGRLVPASLGQIPPEMMDDPDQRRRLERAQLIDEMRAGALAESTLRQYGGHVRAWMAWCRREGVLALPFDPLLVANCLLDYALRLDEETGTYLLDEDGDLTPAVVVGTVDARLKALNKCAEYVGVPRPGDNPGVQQVMCGLRRRFGTATAGKAALDLALLTRCLTAATGLSFTDVRNRAAHLLRARTGATAGQLAALCWSDVQPHDGWTSVSVTLGRTHRHGRPVQITLTTHVNPDLCVVRALEELQGIAPRLGRVLTHPSGEPLTRQAIHQALAAVWSQLPAATDRELARCLQKRCPTTSTQANRDRCLLLTGFWTALRRSNLSALNWGDVDDHGDDGLSLAIRRSKTDQEGQGRVSWVPQKGDRADLDCPAGALRQWRRELEQALGRPLKNNDPVFVALTSAGNVKVGANGRLARLTGDGINEAVQRLAVAAGLAEPGESSNPYGAHSLRAGFVTEAARDDKLTILDIMEVTGHKTPAMVVRYRREVNAPKRNAARKLMVVLAGDYTSVSGPAPIERTRLDAQGSWRRT